MSIKKTWKKWTKAETSELKKLSKAAKSWEELQKAVEQSRILKDRDWRNSVRRAVLSHPDWTKYFTDKRRKVSKEEEIRAKQFLFKEDEKIVPLDTFKISKKVWKKKDTLIGMISRVDYGSTGFRSGFLKLALEEAAREGFRFNVLDGGLVNKNALKEELKAFIKEKGGKLTREEKEAYAEDFYLECAKDLAKLIPRIRKPSGEFIKLYVTISPAFDGKIGDEIAKRLTALRKDNDIVYWDRYDLPLLVKYVDQRLLPAVPLKGTWMRSDYYSTPVDRVLKDILKRSSTLPDMYGVGCFASSFFKPEGDARKAYFSIPALSVLSDTRTAENQIGMRVVDYHKNGEFSVSTYSFKDLIREERKLIKAPLGCSRLQEAIIELLVKDPMSVGVLEYFLKEQSYFKNVTREQIIKAIENLKRFRVGIEFNFDSGLYDFKQEWFQKKAVYELPPKEELSEDCFVTLPCMHASAIKTDYRFIVDEVPKYILRSGAKYLIVPGDLTQGTAHRLLQKGEIYRGINEIEQEMLAAALTETVVAKVFEARFKEAIRNRNANGLTQEELKKIIDDALVTLIYVMGNHDEWKAGAGFTPLKVFKKWLIDLIVKNIKRVLKAHNLHFDGVHSIVVNKVIEDKVTEKIFHTTPSGLAVKVGHPFTARTLTVSIPSERFLNKYPEAHICFTGNWHVSLSLEHFDQEIGQRVVLQSPTLQKYTFFESAKMKKTDFGIGILKVKSHKGRIIITETGFYGEKGDEDKIDNDVLDEMLVKVDIELS